MSTSSFSSNEFFQDFLGKFHSRKLLIQNPLNQQTIIAPPPDPYTNESSLDKNVLMILSVLICTVIFTVVLNSLIRYALNCLKLLVSSDSRTNTSASKSINKGIKKKALKTFPVVKYLAELKLPGLDTECVICLSEFVPGERVRLLPKCNHGFHIGCIDKWLRSNSSCPKCRLGLIETCQKIVGCCQASPPGPSVPVPESSVVSIRSLEPEGVVHNY